MYDKTPRWDKKDYMGLKIYNGRRNIGWLRKKDTTKNRVKKYSATLDGKAPELWAGYGKSLEKYPNCAAGR